MAKERPPVLELEICKQLKAAGFPQATKYSWKIEGMSEDGCEFVDLTDADEFHVARIAAAPTIEELVAYILEAKQ